MKSIVIVSLITLNSLLATAQQKSAKVAMAPVHPVNTRAEIESGLNSHDHALFIKNDWIRDPYIVAGPDGYYYLTGTTANAGDSTEKTDPYNKGLFKGSGFGS